MNIRNLMKTAVGLLILGAMAFFVSLHATSTLAQRQEFTIRQTQTIQSYTGNRGPIQLMHVDAYRKDGSTYTSESFAVNGKPATVAALQLANERKRIVMDMHTWLKSTYPVSDQQVLAWKSGTPSDCSPMIGVTSAQMVGKSQMFGVEVQRFAFDSATATTERNLAPALGCFDLRSVTKWKDSTGQYTSETVRETVELKVGSPDPVLFTVPNGLKETLPSAARNASYEYLYGAGTVSTRECWLNSNNKMDSRYTTANGLKR